MVSAWTELCDPFSGGHFYLELFSSKKKGRQLASWHPVWSLAEVTTVFCFSALVASISVCMFLVLLNKCLLSVSYVSDTVLGIGNAVVIQTDNSFCLCGTYIPVRNIWVGLESGRGKF